VFEELPQVQFSEVITAQGEIRVEHETAPVSRFRLSRSKHDFRSPWEFEVFVSEESRDEFDRALHRRSFPKFVGKTFTGHSIEVPDLRWRSWAKASGALTGVVWEVVIDPDPIPAKPSRQIVTISLSPTTMALEEKPFLARWYTGEIKHDERLSPEPAEKLLYWEGSRGRITLVCYYKYENTRVGESQCLVRIPVSMLQLRLEGDQTSPDPRSLAESMAKEMEGPLRLISFLSRSHVRWSAISVSSESKGADGRPDLHEMHMFRAGVLGEDKSNRDWGLANPYNMAPDGLNTLVTALQQSPYREVLLTAMVYLVTGHNTRVAESSLVSSFTALETVTNGIGGVDGTDQMLAPGAFKRLRKDLESAIESHATGQGLTAEVVPSIVAKLGELNRPAIAPRVCALIERYNVEWKDLWPDDPLEVGVRNMFKVRNAFVHAGYIDMKGRAYIATRRAHILGERLIWQILGGRREWEDVRSYPRTDPLRALEKELDEEEKAGASETPQTGRPEVN
jgi:hypothetical protein